MEPRTIARAIAAGRIGFGVGLVLAPERLTRLWLGRDSARAGTQVASRGLGGRDIALGLGALTAADADLRSWVAGGIAGDAADLLATLAAGGSVPLAGRLAVGTLALGAAALGGVALRGLSRQPS